MRLPQMVRIVGWSRYRRTAPEIAADASSDPNSRAWFSSTLARRSYTAHLHARVCNCCVLLVPCVGTCACASERATRVRVHVDTPINLHVQGSIEKRSHDRCHAVDNACLPQPLLHAVRAQVIRLSMHGDDESMR